MRTAFISVFYEGIVAIPRYARISTIEQNFDLQLDALKQKGGSSFTEEILSFLAPYRTENLNRFGSYDMKLDRAPEPLDESLYLPVNLMN